MLSEKSFPCQANKPLFFIYQYININPLLVFLAELISSGLASISPDKEERELLWARR